MILPLSVVCGCLLFLLFVWYQEAVLFPILRVAREHDIAFYALLDWREQHPDCVLACHPEAQRLVDARLRTLRKYEQVYRLPHDSELARSLLQLRNDKQLADYPDTNVPHAP